MFPSYRNQSVNLLWLTGFYMMGTLVVKGLSLFLVVLHYRVKHRIFWYSLKIRQNETKKLIFWLIFEDFLFTSSYAL